MNENAQRIAIAEACGWEWRSINGGWHRPCGTYEGESEACLPDYLHDLNAMHEAEKVLLTGDGWKDRLAKYSSKLMTVMHGTDFGRIDVAFKNDMVHLRYFTLHATAAQRAEAFLRTIGKWKEAQ